LMRTHLVLCNLHASSLHIILPSIDDHEVILISQNNLRLESC